MLYKKKVLIVNLSHFNFNCDPYITSICSNVAMAVLSIACLRGKDNKPVLKELAVIYYANGKSHLKVLCFKAPYSESELPIKVQRTNNWIAKNLHENVHGLKWGSGDIPYENLKKVIFSMIESDENDLYAKGTENCTLLSGILGRKVRNLEDYGCPKADEIDVQVASLELLGRHRSDAAIKCITYEYWLSQQEYEHYKVMCRWAYEENSK
jgi:hypothetical protein